MQFLNEKDQCIRQLENENRTLQEKVDLLERNVEVLTQVNCSLSSRQSK